MPICGTTSGWGAPACWRCAAAASRAGATSRRSTTSVATPICAATSTCSSSATTCSTPTPSCASRLIEAMLTPIGILGGVRGVFFAGAGGAYFNNSGLQVLGEQHHQLHPDHRVQPRPGDRAIHTHTGAAARDHGIPARGRPRVLWVWPGNVRAGLPHPLRLGVAHALQQELGGRALRRQRRQRRVPPAPVQGVGRVRLLRHRSGFNWWRRG